MVDDFDPIDTDLVEETGDPKKIDLGEDEEEIDEIPDEDDEDELVVPDDEESAFSEFSY